MSFRSEDQMLLGETSMNADFASPAINVAGYIGVAIQLLYTGAPVGFIVLQASGSPTNIPDNVDPDSWIDVASDPVLAAGNTMFNVRTPFFKWLRVVYRRSSGTGLVEYATMNLRIT